MWSARIVHGNACRVDWESVCPKNDEDEIYILGNPPYLDTRNQEKHHKEDMKFVFQGVNKYKSLDYIAAWFLIASNYIRGVNGKYAFVSTNSISQGDHPSIFWRSVLNSSQEVFFAHQTFKWTNSAKKNAGVSVVIVGVRNESNDAKHLYSGNKIKKVSNISPYLVEGPDLVVSRSSSSISSFPEMIKGSIPADGGNLVLNEQEGLELLKNDHIKNYIKKFIGAQELIKGYNRYCIYVTKSEYEKVKEIPVLAHRFDGVKKMRLNSTKNATVALAKYPYKFAEDRYYNKPCLLIPCVTSERRDYTPLDLLKKDQSFMHQHKRYIMHLHLFLE